MSELSPEIVASVVESAGERSNRIENRNQALCFQALEMMAAGESLDSISRSTQLTRNTLKLLKERHSEALSVRRKRWASENAHLADAYREVCRRKVAQLLDNPEALEKTNLKDLSIAYGIVGDKADNASEENVNKSSGPSLEDALAAVEAANKRIENLKVLNVKEVSDE